eukprot:gene17279-biopygen6829
MLVCPGGELPGFTGISPQGTGGYSMEMDVPGGWGHQTQNGHGAEMCHQERESNFHIRSWAHPVAPLHTTRGDPEGGGAAGQVAARTASSVHVLMRKGRQTFLALHPARENVTLNLLAQYLVAPNVPVVRLRWMLTPIKAPREHSQHFLAPSALLLPSILRHSTLFSISPSAFGTYCTVELKWNATQLIWMLAGASPGRCSCLKPLSQPIIRYGNDIPLGYPALEDKEKGAGLPGSVHRSVHRLCYAKTIATRLGQVFGDGECNCIETTDSLERVRKYADVEARHKIAKEQQCAPHPTHARTREVGAEGERRQVAVDPLGKGGRQRDVQHEKTEGLRRSPAARDHKNMRICVSACLHCIASHCRLSVCQSDSCPGDGSQQPHKLVGM